MVMKQNAREFRTERIDFRTRIIEVKGDVLRTRFEPDPARYDVVTTNDGDQLWFDREQGIVWSVNDLLPLFKNQPIYAAPRRIEDLQLYVTSRRQVVKSILRGSTPSSPPQQNTVPETLKNHVLLSVDIVNSTGLSASLAPHLYDLLIEAYQVEISNIAENHNAIALGEAGDGLMFAFGSRLYIQNIDSALWCALAMRGVVSGLLNPAFIEIGAGPINIRIGINSGIAIAKNSRGNAKLVRPSVRGLAVNLTGHIVSAASPGQILVGEDVQRLCHIGWRDRMTTVSSLNTPYAESVLVGGFRLFALDDPVVDQGVI